MYDLVVRGGTLVTAAGEWQADLGVRDGRIAAIAAPGGLGLAEQVIDAAGRHVLPGLVDADVHLRDPGFTHKEDFRSGTMAAVAGGVTTVMAIPKTNPPITTPAAFHGAREAAAAKAVVDYAVFAGARIADPEGVTAFIGSPAIAYDMYDDPYQAGTGAWLELFRRVNETGLPLCFSLNDEVLREHRRKILEGRAAPAHQRWVGSMPGSLEVLCMGRIVPLAAQGGVPVVLRSVTTAEGLASLRQMRRAFPEARVTVETNVHYLFLTAEDLAAMGTRAHMNPPLRPAEEQAALWQAVRDGTVDYIATDHAPHAPSEKALDDLFQSPPASSGWRPCCPSCSTPGFRGASPSRTSCASAAKSPPAPSGSIPRRGPSPWGPTPTWCWWIWRNAGASTPAAFTPGVNAGASTGGRSPGGRA